MSTSYSVNTKQEIPAVSDRFWNVPLTDNINLLDSMSPIGGLFVTLAEVPSASLNVTVAAGAYQKQDGTVGSYAGAASQAMTTATTNYIYLTSAGTLTVNTTGYPTTDHVRLATVVAGATTITSITDNRVVCGVLGSWADGVNITIGTSTGSRIGTAVGQKLGFWAATPVVQPSGASQAAAAAQTQTSLTDSTGGTVSTTLAAITAGSSYAQADMTACKNAIASLAAELALVKTDVANVKTLEDAIRTALVNTGLIKGSA